MFCRSIKYLTKYFLSGVFEIRMIVDADCYSPITLDERVTIWLQRIPSLPGACVYVTLFARRLAYNHYATKHAYNEAKTHAQGIERAC